MAMILMKTESGADLAVEENDVRAVWQDDKPGIIGIELMNETQYRVYGEFDHFVRAIFNSLDLRPKKPRAPAAGIKPGTLPARGDNVIVLRKG